MNGSIVSVGSFSGNGDGEQGLVIKVRDINKDQLVGALEALGDHVLDVRDV
jgi:hypothetical protein